MLFPAYYSIKSLLKSPQMKDKANAWHLVFLLDQDRAELRHKKTQIVLGTNFPYGSQMFDF